MSRIRPWIDQYDPSVPANLDYPKICVHDYLKIQKEQNPVKAAVIYGTEVTSYKALSKMVTNLAFDLIQFGIKPEERVGICLPNSLEFVVAFFAVLQAGGVVAAMNPQFPARELEFQVETAKVKLVITNVAKKNDFASMGTELKPDIFLVTKQGDSHDVSVRCVTRQLNVSGSEDAAKFPAIDPSAAAVLQFSGGTTGTPKAAIGMHKNLVANVTQFRNWLVNLDDGHETFLIAIPLYHVYGLVLGLILGIATGATLVFVENPGNADEMLNLINKYPVSYFPGVPSLFNLINNHPSVINGDCDLHSIKACISGSAPLQESVRLDFEKFTRGSLVEGYGLSEAPTATHCNPILGEKRPGSIGLPLPDVDCKIVNIDNDQIEVPPGEEGQLLIRGPQIMSGYFNAARETKVTLTDGWLHTGDVARMDKEGYFFLSGRIKDLIKVHGMQVWPHEVEEVLRQIPAINECAVAGVPDEACGEKVMAWIVLRPDKSTSMEEVKRFCQEKLAAYKIPSKLKICDSLPKTPVGKVLRRELVREYLEGLINEQGA